MTDEFLTFRDHFLSLYQSIAAEVANGQQDQIEVRSTLEGTKLSKDQNAIIKAAGRVARARVAYQSNVHDDVTNLEAMSPLETAQVCASLAFQLLEAKVSGDVVTARRINETLQGSTCDPGWAKT